MAPHVTPPAAIAPPPPILAHARDLLGGYDVLLSDVWGVVHDGRRAFVPACDALARFRAGGGTVILVSNAPVPEAQVAQMLQRRKVPRAAWDAIVSSGSIALAHIAEQGYTRAYYIGPLDRDAAFFEQSPAKASALIHADAVVCTGLNDDKTETAESYRAVLEEASAFGLPFVCANPDLVVDVGGRLYPCAGALADLYEHLGGDVFWAGKPHRIAYDTALAAAEGLRGAPVARERILVVGDALRTDLKAAENAGLDAMFIAAGIHRGDAMDGDELSPAKLAELFTPGAPRAIAAMTMLRW
jgi:HAD superfamily hydrolase (TIGR01459 family)